MCDNCGTYNGREVVDVLAKQTKKQDRLDRKTRELGQEVVEDKKKESKTTKATKEAPVDKEPKVLNPEQLSSK